jgi:hypothetical protein
MARLLRIRNWSRFQHYKDRNPPWIKLHAEVFTSQDWVALDDTSKALMLICMVVAAKHDGCVPDDPDYIKRVAYLSKRPNLKPLIDCGFLEIPQADASERKQEQADAITLLADARPEKESSSSKNSNKSEAETESISGVPPSKHVSKNPLNGHQKDFETFYAAFPKRVKVGDARKAYAAALKKGATPEIMLAGAQRYALSRAREDPKFTAYPGSWLRAESWADEAQASGPGIDPLLLKIQELANAK